MATAKLKRDLQTLVALGEPVRRDLYFFVAGQQDAVSRDDVANGLGIGRPLAAFHLDRLVDAGLLEAHYKRLSGRAGRGAGRPSKLYRPSRREVAVTIPPRHHELLGRFFAEGLAPGPGRNPEQRVLRAAREYGSSLGARARSRVSRRAGEERLRQCAVDVLGGLGYSPYPTRSGETRLRDCPFHPLSKRYPETVCKIGLAFVGAVVDGVGLTDVRTKREPKAGNCCVVLGGLDTPAT